MSRSAYSIKKSYRRLRRTLRRLTKRSARRALGYFVGVAIIVIITALFVAGKDTKNVNYTGLLNTIAAGESTGNYNAYYGNPGNKNINFTAMTVGAVLDWQRAYVEQGSASNAVGKYQFIRPTLLGLVKEMNISTAARFDQALQDRLAIRLLERRGVNDYINGRISREQLAYNLSKEWAALPRVIGSNPAASYYDGDGLNHVQVSIDEVLTAITSLHHPNSI